jgi:hypothetical protein
LRTTARQCRTVVPTVHEACKNSPPSITLEATSH